MLMVMSDGAQKFWRRLMLERRRALGSAARLRARGWQGVKRVDIRKPLHALSIAVILAGIVAPIADWVATNEQYRMSDAIKAVAESAAPDFENKLLYDGSKHASIFNAAGGDVGKDALAGEVGGGKNQLYTSTLPDDPSQGVEVADNVNHVSVRFVPQMGLLGGRTENGHVVYPLKDAAGQMIFTPKGNGLKEDIVLTTAPKNDVVEFHYHLVFPSSLVARLEDDGSIGFYSGDPQLFGNISYGSDKDRAAVDKARENSPKTYLMFRIPAPRIRETGKSTTVAARFNLSGNDLTVRAAGLGKAHYPLSIDPTFLLTSTADFVLGSIDDNIDLSVANQVGRQALVGGSTPGWTALAAPNLTYANFASSLVAYNGFLYLIGGGSGNNTTNGGAGASGTTSNDVRYICLNPTTGALGTNGGCTPAAWTNTGNSLLGTARQGLVAFGFNGYLYAIGGEDNSGNPITTASGHTVEYAKINSDGTVGTWNYGSSLNTARSYPAGAIYQGILYVMGGTSANNNTTPVSTIEWARIKGDGTLGTWTQSTSSATGNLTSARSKFQGGAYNGFVYVSGGQTSSTTVINTIQYAPIHSDGSLGAWVTTTAFPTARRDHGMAINNGYVYVFAGCTGAAEPCASFIKDMQYAVINPDGSIGQWQSSLPYDSGHVDNVADYNTRMPAGVTSYSNHLYFVGGCSAETATNNCGTQLVGTFISNIDAVGRFDQGLSNLQTTVPYNNNASTVARMGGGAVALNGYLYYISGSATSGGTAYSSVVEDTPINADGTLGTFSTTTALPASVAGDNAGRVGFTVAAYNNKIYVIGGVELLTAGGDNFMKYVLTGTQGSSGAITGWVVETNTIPRFVGSTSDGVGYHTTVQWHNYIYVIGGFNGTQVSADIMYSQIQSNGTLGTWNTTTNGLSQARWAAAGGIWGNWLYAVGGEANAAGTTFVGTTGANHAVEQFTIQSNGNITSASTGYAYPISQRHANGFVQNGYLYTFGGITSGSTAATNNIYWARLDPSTGGPATFVNTNIGNTPAGTAGLTTARHQIAAVTANGVMYILGGCTSTLALGATNFDACTAFVTTAHTTEVFLPNNGGTGDVNAFSSATALSTATADHATVAYNGVLYEIGGCTAYTTGVCTSGSNSNAISQAPINPDTATAPGQLGSWSTSATTIPVAGRSLLQAVAYNGYLYVIGGRTDSTAAVGTVAYTTIGSTGTLGTSWNNADLPSGAERNAFGATVLNGFIYVAGGDNGSGTKKSDVYYAQISTVDGSLGTWTQNTNSFTTARSALSVVGYNGRLYVIGGTDGTNTLTDVQFATQANDGSLGTFSYTGDVSRGMSFRQAVGANGYLYFVGDEGDGTELQYADINANGTLGPMSRATHVMAGAHAHGAMSWFGGFFYEIGGCTMTAGACTTGGLLTSDEFAGQEVISRVGHYSKLFNTQVDTSPTQLVINGANNGPGAAVEFKLQTASSADPVLGVAQLIRPVIFNNFYNVQALNSSGANVGVALNYLFLITLDDSRSGTFPDVSYAGATGFAQTAVTDITLYYHANPGRRLRHGASFTSTDCNPAIPASLPSTAGCLLDTAP